MSRKSPPHLTQAAMCHQRRDACSPFILTIFTVRLAFSCLVHDPSRSDLFSKTQRSHTSLGETQIFATAGSGIFEVVDISDKIPPAFCLLHPKLATFLSTVGLAHATQYVAHPSARKPAAFISCPIPRYCPLFCSSAALWSFLPTFNYHPDLAWATSDRGVLARQSFPHLSSICFHLHRFPHSPTCYHSPAPLIV